MSIKVDFGTQTYNIVTLEEMRFPFWTKKSLFCAQCSYAWLLSADGPLLLYKFNESRLCLDCRHSKDELENAIKDNFATAWVNEFVNVELFRCCGCGENANLNHKCTDHHFARIPIKTFSRFTKHRYCKACFEYRKDLGRLSLEQCDWDECKRFMRNRKKRKSNPF